MPDARQAPCPDNGLQSVLDRISSKFDASFETMDIDGQALQVLSINNMPDHLDRLLRKKAIHDPLRDLPLWAKIWPASFVLGRFLRKYEPVGKSMLELGCGMGICSLIAARHGFERILATDLMADALDFTRANILRNGLENVVRTSRLDITGNTCDASQTFDVIAASELLYLDDLHRPLLKFIGRHLAPGGKAFFCHDLARDKKHFLKLAQKGFAIQEGKIGVRSMESDGTEQRRVYSMIILERK